MCRQFGMFFVLLIAFSLLVGIQVGAQSNESAPWASLKTGKNPVAIMAVPGQMGWTLLVLNTTPSDRALQDVMKWAQSEKLSLSLDDVKNTGSISAFYGTKDGRFMLGGEGILYKEVAINESTTEGILRKKEKLACVAPAPMLWNGAHVIIGSNRTPYIFSVNSGLDNISLVNSNSKSFTETQNLQYLQFSIGDSGIALGDFNGDKKYDLVLINDGDFTCTVYQGDGQDDFFKLKNSKRTMMKQWVVGGAGDEPRFVMVTDLNNDGNDDIVVAKGGILSRNIWIVLGNGDGTFQAPHEYPATQRPRSIVAGDFNSDGRLDLVVAGSTSLAFLAGHGDGTFARKEQIGSLEVPQELAYPIGMVVRDFNKDGKLDFAVANPGNNTVDIYAGDGSGKFHVSDSISTGTGSLPLALASEDFTSDGYYDLAVVCNKANEVAIFANNGDGTFRNNQSRVGTGVSAMQPGDFNGDTITDLAFVRTGVEIPAAATQKCSHSADQTVKSMELIGQLSLTYPTYANSNLSVVYGGHARSGVSLQKDEQPDGSFMVLKRGKYNPTDLSRAELMTAAGAYPTSLAVGDLDAQTESEELVATNFGSNSVTIFSWQGNTLRSTGLNFFAAPFGQQGFPRALVRAVVIGDFNKDGKGDLAFANYGANEVYISISLGKGATGKINFQNLFDLDVNPSTLLTPNQCAVGKAPIAIASGDFNGDGYPDLVVANLLSNTLSILINQEGIPIPPQASEATREILSTLKSEGIPIFKVGSEEEIKTTENEGSKVQIGPYSLAVSDFDKENGPDIAVANFASNTVSILYNDGTGRFKTIRTFPVGEGPSSIAVGYASYVDKAGKQVSVSLNNDTWPDLAVANYLDNTVTILLNKGGKGNKDFTPITVSGPAYNLLHKKAAIENGPRAIGVGFFDDMGKDVKTLDIAVGVEFPAHLLKESLNIAGAVGNDKKSLEAEAKALGDTPQDVYIIYGPFGK